MKKFVFRFKEEKLGEKTDYVPKIPVEFSNAGKRFDTLAYLDTGSTISYLPKEIAELLGLELGKKVEKAEGIGGDEDFRASSVTLVIRQGHENSIINLPVFVFENPARRLVILGRLPLFQMFDICFNASENRIIMKEAPGK